VMDELVEDVQDECAAGGVGEHAADLPDATLKRFVGGCGQHLASSSASLGEPGQHIR
jgi:hypothetical protein